MTHVLPEAPQFNLEAIHRVAVRYDAEFDIVYLHIGAPRPAITDDVGGGWHIRTDEDDQLVGLELHGLRQIFLTNRFYARVFAPAIRELEAASGTRFLEGDGVDLDVEGSADELRRTTDLLIFMVGEALARYEGQRR